MGGSRNRRRLRAALLAGWMFVGLQVLALPAEALASCQMACAVNGGFCCCTGFGGTSSHHRSGDGSSLTRPHLASHGKRCPAFAGPSSADSRELVDNAESTPRPTIERSFRTLLWQAPSPPAAQPFLLGSLPRPPPNLV